MGWVTVQKAKPKGRGKPGSPDYVKIHTAADSTAPSMSLTFLNDINNFKREFDALEDLIRQGALDNLDLKLPWQELQDVLQLGITEGQLRALTKGADHAANRTRKLLAATLGVTPLLNFDPTNPKVARYLEKNAALKAVDITQETRRALSQAILRSRLGEPHPIELFRDVKRTVGLTRQQATSVANFKAQLERNGHRKADVKRLVDDMADRQLRMRAERIARTETMLAATQGQKLMWSQAAEMGLFDPSTSKTIWIVTPDDRLCPTCKPMQGEPADPDGTWSVTIYNEKGAAVGRKVVSVPAEIHPHCRCVPQLILEGAAA